MQDKFRILGWWGHAHRTRSECAARACEILKHLRSIDDRFARLHLVGRSLKKRWGKPLAMTPDELAAQFEQDRVFPEKLGFTLHAVLPPEEEVTLRIQDGTTSGCLPPDIIAVEIDTRLSADVQELLTFEKVLGVLSSIVGVYEPVWAGAISSRQFHELHLTGAMPFASWMLYLPLCVSQLPRLPPPVVVRTLGNGILIITTSERFDAANMAHMALSADITQRLDAAGVLEVPWQKEMWDENGNADGE